MTLDQVIISYLAGESEPQQAKAPDEDAEWEQARREWSREEPTKVTPPQLLWRLRGLSAKGE